MIRRSSRASEPTARRHSAWGEALLVAKAVSIAALAVILVVMLFVLLMHWEHVWPF